MSTAAGLTVILVTVWMLSLALYLHARNQTISAEQVSILWRLIVWNIGARLQEWAERVGHLFGETLILRIKQRWS